MLFRSKSGCAANFISKKTGISLMMSNNLIKNNFCQKGGGVFIQNVQQVSIENNTFNNTDSKSISVSKSKRFDIN